MDVHFGYVAVFLEPVSVVLSANTAKSRRNSDRAALTKV